MLIPHRSVALVGRPNVGKSRLFNRLAGQRLAIVHDMPGVTRDVNAIELPAGHTLLDTGGIGLATNQENASLIAAAEEQVFFAISAASVVVFVVDAQTGLTPLDEVVATHLRATSAKVLLVVNKADTGEYLDRYDDFSRLGFGTPMPVSAEHDRGISTLEEEVLRLLGPKPPEVEVERFPRVRIAFAGRPNVGKSSLCNALLKSERLVVSEVAGTTRDSVELDLDYAASPTETWHFRLIDTAGVRRRTKVNTSVEFFSSLRTVDALPTADVVFLVIDALDGVGSQEQKLAGDILEMGRNLAIIVNKWDLAHKKLSSGGIEGYEDERDFREKFEEAVRRQLFFLPNSPIIFASAVTGHALERILKAALEIERKAQERLSTGKINTLIAKLIQKREPKIIGLKRFKVYYGVQVNTKPHTIRLFCNRETALEDAYRRYLEKGFVQEFGLDGCCLRFVCAGKEKRYVGKNPQIAAEQVAAKKYLKTATGERGSGERKGPGAKTGPGGVPGRAKKNFHTAPGERKGPGGKKKGPGGVPGRAAKAAKYPNDKKARKGPRGGNQVAQLQRRRAMREKPAQPGE